MKLKRLLSVFLALVMVFALLPAVSAPARAAADTVHLSGTTGGCTWTLDNDPDLYGWDYGLTLRVRPTDGVGPAAMDEDIEYYINPYSFRVQAVIIEDGVTNVCDHFLFSGSRYTCFDNLKQISLPDSVTSVGELAFFSADPWDYSLSSLNVEHLESIGDSAFQGMHVDGDLTFTSLRTLTKGCLSHITADNIFLPNVTVTPTESSYCFSGTKANVDLSGTKLTTITQSLFYGFKGSALSLPATLKKVEAFAFGGGAVNTLKDIYFAGTPQQWASIEIDHSENVYGEDENAALSSATVHYAMKGTVSIPSACTKGQTLTASVSGTTASASARHYQWQRKTKDWTNIPGATNSTYTVKANDVNCQLRVVVYADGYYGSIFSGACACEDGIELSSANFPNASFKNYLATNFDNDKDSWLNATEISAITSIEIHLTALTDLEGIQYLNCLRSVDVSGSGVTRFDATDWELANLVNLDLSDNPLEVLNVWICRELETLDLHGTDIEDEQLWSISLCPKLRDLRLYDLSYSWTAPIAENPLLVEAALHGTKSTVKYGGYDTYQYSLPDGTLLWMGRDEEECIYVAEFAAYWFPDPEFRSYLRNNDDINFNDDDRYLDLQEAKYVECIDISNLTDNGKQLVTLQGVEFFPNLFDLRIVNCGLEEADLSRNPQLDYLDLEDNALTALDLTGCTNLRSLYCGGNENLTRLDVRSCTNLEWLYCSYTALTYVDLSHNMKLAKLGLGYNALKGSLDLHSYNRLTWLYVPGNGITSLNLVGLSNLATLTVEGNASLKELDCTDCALKTLSMKGCTALEWLYCSGNDLTSLDVSQNPALKILSCFGNSLTALDISACPNLGEAYVSGTKTQYSSGGWDYCSYSKGFYDLSVDQSTQVTVGDPPVITTHPSNKTAAAGATATFTVAASGTGLTYQWQYKTSGSSTWKDKSGATKSSYTVTAKESYNGIQYRCKVSNGAGSVTSNPATLTVTVTETAPAITTQPKAQTAAAGETATFKVVATGGNLKYQWQYSTDYGKTWHDKTGSTKATHTVTVKATYNGYLYRCIITNSKGTVTSSKVRLTVSGVKPKILSQPAAKTAAAGESVTFKVVAAGVGMTYQWQYKTAGSTTWKDKSGATKSSYTVTAKESYNGIQYRCKVTNSIGYVYSDGAALTVKSAVTKPEITTQPKAQTAAAGETATFKVVASGTGLTYQWQYSTDYGKTWHDKAGSTKATHTVTVKASYNGYLYRCKVTNSAGTVTSSKVRLTVSGVKPKILSQPAAASAAAGESVTFKVVAAGVGMTYQWQYKTAGSTTWKDKSGATSASYTTTANTKYNGIQYRCVVTNSIGSVTSDPAVLTVK